MNRHLFVLTLVFALFITQGLNAADHHRPVDYVNPFIGTTNFGTTNPGAVCPNGLMSVVPFNVMGSEENLYDKDARWWSTPYEFHNTYFTGFSHVNLSGVGCPELGSLLVMPTTGALNVDYKAYGSAYTGEQASPGYYTNRLSRYQITTEASATPRTGILRFTFPEGESHILLNLGEGLTNESGAFVRRVNDREVEGMKLLGTFCYNPQAVFPIYFVMRVGKQPRQNGYWKKQRPMTGVEAEWDPDHGRYKLYPNYSKEMAGDDVGAYFSFDTQEGEQIEVQMGVSFVSIENARLNLESEQTGKHFEEIRAAAAEKWNDDLSRIRVEGGTDEQKTVFYTALYHTLIHPNILQDVNGQYPAMESGEIRTTKGNRYTVFSLWDTYRNLHQLLTLAYPERQMEMIQTMLDMYREHGWLPKWELYGRETLTMEGDPAIPVIVDSWMKGLRDFDVELAYEAMRKSATLPGAQNLMRPDNDDYMALGYVPLREKYDNSVSHALEYYIADFALSRFAAALGKKKDADYFYNRSLGYKHYYDEASGAFRPLLPDGSFYAPFDPRQGENFEPNPGFHEGSAWNYTFYVPHDIEGLTRLMGGKKPFVEKLQRVFDEGLYDPANEPDIAYPHLFSYFPGEEWRTQQLTRELLEKHFTNQPDGIPGNDDTGTMSGWAVFNMMGFYPDCPGLPEYTLTTPVFDKITIRLDKRWYEQDSLVIETARTSPQDKFIKAIRVGDEDCKAYRIDHRKLAGAGKITFYLAEDRASLVNPFIGTDFTGNTYPGAQAPFGMVQLSPDNGLPGWDRISGYFYPDSTIAGFSHTHLSGTGAGDLYDISFMPVTLPYTEAEEPLGIHSKFSHDDEQATAGYYRVRLTDYDIHVELTATDRCGIQRYTFPEARSAVFLNLKKAMNWDATCDSYVEVVDSVTIQGYRFSDGWARGQRVFFRSRFSKPFTRVQLDTTALTKEGQQTGTGYVARFDFDTRQGEQLIVSTALSGVSMEGAAQNLLAEAPEDNFDARLAQTRRKWNDELGKIEVSTPHRDDKVKFYTALYHAMLAPTIYSDVDGAYYGPDKKIHRAGEWTNYSTFSLWDTYRAAHPLYTYTNPDRVNDMVKSLIAFYEQHGRLPVWNFYGSETDMMIGYHAVAVIADAYLKGIGDFDAKKALEACVNTANTDAYRGIGHYKRLGYVPYNVEDRYNSENWSLSKTLEYAFDDYCIAMMARKMGETATADTFFRRSRNYKNLYNPATGFMQPRDDKGNFLSGFDPDDYTGHITESNGWQYFWSVQHDIDGLIGLAGGKERFAQKLDSMFTYAPADQSGLPIFSTGMIGQYAHGNEPGHHVIHLFNAVDQPWKTQAYVAKVMNELYLNTPAGLCGNEDCGQMSAWYVFNAMGFYPVNPVSGRYEIGTPLFPEIKLNLSNGNTFTVRAPQINKENVYIQGVNINNVPYDKSYITHEQLMNGATLEFVMCNEPCPPWYK